jgi:hypothetical protein
MGFANEKLRFLLSNSILLEAASFAEKISLNGRWDPSNFDRIFKVVAKR